MQPPGPGALRFLHGVKTRGFLDVMGELWREYGDVVQIRVGSRTLILAVHPDAVEQVTGAGRGKYDKVASYDPVRRYLTGDGLVASTGELWRKQRKLMAPFFTPKGIRSYAEVMIEDSVRLQQRWAELAHQGSEVEMSEEMTAVTASIILKAMFSAASSESIREMKEAVETMISFVTLRMTSLWLPLWVPTSKNRRYVAARKLVHASIGGLVAKRRALDAATWPDDFLSRLMRARDEDTGEAMSESLLRDEAITAFFAGHETTARTLTFTWYALATHPDVMARLHDELDKVLGGALPNVDQLRQLPYTLQVIKEVLRLYPAAPFYMRDALEADQIGGFDVPKGAGVMLSPYYTHRHPRFWHEPERFDPERWAGEQPRPDAAYHPFGAGPRICIGNNFSLLESHLLLAILAQRFTPRLCSGYTPCWQMKGVLGLSNGLPMRIAAREASR